MLIQLEIESLIKQIQRDSLKNEKSVKSIHYQSTSSSQSDDDKSTSSSLLEKTKIHIQSSHQILKRFYLKLDRQIYKIGHISSDTFLSDKIIRLIGSIIKILRVFKLVKNVKSFQKISVQIVQLRRLLRYNRFLSYMREIKHLILKQNKRWLDFYNIVFKNLQLVLDTNDTLSYFQQMKLISKKSLNSKSLKKNVSNLYFIECLMWLFLNIYDYIKNREHRTRAQNLRKQLTIAKYALDSFTSHNQCSKRLYTLSPRTNTLIGFVSSVVGLYVLWV